MYSLVSGLIDWYFKTPTLRILIVGEESCGKTVKYLTYILKINNTRLFLKK